MKKLTNITIYKRKDITVATKPTHDIVASDSDYQNKTTIGSLWTRTSQDGNKFLSGKLSEERSFEGKTYDGYVVLSTKEYKELISNQKPSGVTIPRMEYGEVNVADLDF